MRGGQLAQHTQQQLQKHDQHSAHHNGTCVKQLPAWLLIELDKACTTTTPPAPTHKHTHPPALLTARTCKPLAAKQAYAEGAAEQPLCPLSSPLIRAYTHVSPHAHDGGCTLSSCLHAPCTHAPHAHRQTRLLNTTNATTASSAALCLQCSKNRGSRNRVLTAQHTCQQQCSMSPSTHQHPPTQPTRALMEALIAVTSTPNTPCSRSFSHSSLQRERADTP